MRRTRKSWAEINSRKAERYSEIGRKREVEVEELLKKATLDGELIFEKVIRHEPFSANGKNFTVYKKLDGMLVSRSFGISISARSTRASMMKHPKVPQFHLPLNINPSTIIRKIDRLFLDSNA